MKFSRHFFVCENARPEGGKPSCAARGSTAIRARLAEGLAAHPELCAEASVTPTGCLGPCFEGPTLVVYPEGTWYAGVTVEDVDEIVRSHLVGGRAVARLVYRWPE